ncbi:MAG: glutathione S-transferase family protein [Pseudomonadota bacterium]
MTNPSPDITLYHAPRSRSVRVRWCLEEMGLPYRLERPAFNHGDVGGEAFRAINPLQKVPAMTDHGVLILESNAMVDYLTSVYGPTSLRATPDEPDYARYLEWLHYGEASLSMCVNLFLGHSALLPEAQRNPGIAKWSKTEIDKHLNHIAERGLDGREWLACDRFTAADLSVGYMLFLLKIMKALSDAPDAVQAYWSRIAERPAWRTASAD